PLEPVPTSETVPDLTPPSAAHPETGPSSTPGSIRSCPHPDPSATLPARLKTHKLTPSVRILHNQKPVDLPAQRQIRPIIADQINSVRRPVIPHHILCAPQPVPQHLEKSPFQSRCRSLHVFRKRLHRLLVRLEEQSVLALEVLEHRPLGNAQLRRNIFHPRRAIPALGKMPYRRLHNPRPLRFRARTRLPVPPHLHRLRQTARNSFHGRTPLKLF